VCACKQQVCCVGGGRIISESERKRSSFCLKGLDLKIWTQKSDDAHIVILYRGRYAPRPRTGSLRWRTLERSTTMRVQGLSLLALLICISATTSSTSSSSTSSHSSSTNNSTTTSTSTTSSSARARRALPGDEDGNGPPAAHHLRHRRRLADEDGGEDEGADKEGDKEQAPAKPVKPAAAKPPVAVKPKAPTSGGPGPKAPMAHKVGTPIRKKASQIVMGEATKNPKVFILGVQKGGSSSMMWMLIMHPQLCSGERKETHFFTGIYEKLVDEGAGARFTSLACSLQQRVVYSHLPSLPCRQRPQ